MADPTTISDQVRYKKAAKAAAEVGEVVEQYNSWKHCQTELEEARSMIDDPDIEVAELARQEIVGLEERCDGLEEMIKRLMLPKDPNDEKGIVLEIRAGTGGDEATLFAAELHRMYARYSESRNDFLKPFRSRRIEGSDLPNFRPSCLQQTQVRGWCAPRTKSPEDRDSRTYTHLRCDSCHNATG